MLRIKKILISVWNEFVYGGHLLSLGAVSIVFTAAVLLGIKITWDFLAIIYFGTQSVYLYNRYKEFKSDFLTNPERTAHIQRYLKKIPLIIFLLIIFIIVISLYFNKISGLVFALLLISFGFLYSIHFKKITKKIAGFKNFFVSLMWALLIILLVVYYSISFNLSVYLIFIFIYLRFLVSTNFFDIKDIESDKKDGLLTFPILFGQKNLFYFLIIINIFSGILIAAGTYLNLLPKYSLVLIFFVFYSFYYFKKLNDKETNEAFLNYVVVDGEFILWLPIVLLGKSLFI